jgi:hypothetical protein
MCEARLACGRVITDGKFFTKYMPWPIIACSEKVI